VKVAFSSQPFDRLNPFSIQSCQTNLTGPLCFAVDNHRAGTAVARSASILCSHQMQRFSQEIQERFFPVGLYGHLLSINAKDHDTPCLQSSHPRTGLVISTRLY
jgi:hypothetical protein